MTRTTWIAALALALMLALGCKEKQYLTGYYDWDKFQKECHWETFVDEEYKPNEAWMDSLSTLKGQDPVKVQLFLGCYCGDSKKWVPRFYKLMPDLPVAEVEIISVDTTKKDEKNLAAMAQIKKIPTFIFLDGSTEIGRIVEKPKKGRMEKNLFLILKKAG